MKIRPAIFYRNLLTLAFALFVFYAFYRIVAYDDGNHEHLRRRQKHLYLTVSKDRIESRLPTLSPKRILLWTPIFGSYPTGVLDDCKDFVDRCIFDTDHSRIAIADAVVFHSKDITSRPFPDQNQRNITQKYVYMSMETPENSGMYAVPNEIKSLPENLFNWIATPLLSSDVIFKYGSFWIKTADAERKGFRIESFHFDIEKMEKKRKGVFGLISNCNTANKREKIIEALSKHIEVTIAGKCKNKPEYAELCPRGKDCRELFEEYPFFFAIENSDCRDYVTEKYWDRYKYVSIPIVMQRWVYEGMNAPPKSFIAVDDFKNINEMGEYLNHLQGNKTAYMEYFKWRNGDWTIAPWNYPGYRNGWCKLCEKLWDSDNSTDVSQERIKSVYEHYTKESHCDVSFTEKWLST
ncbi:unnamed protein product [Auanema sp. JU1783]|nr:unnamed protein product [Auanema sp. JU1783]